MRFSKLLMLRGDSYTGFAFDADAGRTRPAARRADSKWDESDIRELTGLLTECMKKERAMSKLVKLGQF